MCVTSMSISQQIIIKNRHFGGSNENYSIFYTNTMGVSVVFIGAMDLNGLVCLENNTI
jgi:hypothetical protein